MSSSEAPIRVSPKDRIGLGIVAFKSIISSFFQNREGDHTTPPHRLPQYSNLPQPKNRFLEAATRVVESKTYSASTSSEAPYGYYQGRHIIGDCTRFIDGIFIGHQPQDAVVIDERYGVLAEVYKGLLERISETEIKGAHAEYRIFNQVINFVSEVIRVDERETENFAKAQQIGVDNKISLDVYVIQGFGLDYHQVLLAGYLFEKLADAKKLLGVATLDSTLTSENSESDVLLYRSSSGCTFRFAPREQSVKSTIH